MDKRNQRKVFGGKGIIMTCKCTTCKYVRQMEILIPDDDLRNKVMALTDRLYEAMASEIIDLEMKLLARKKGVKHE